MVLGHRRPRINRRCAGWRAQRDADRGSCSAETILRLPIADNQQVEAGAVLVELDPRDYQGRAGQGRVQKLAERPEGRPP